MNQNMKFVMPAVPASPKSGRCPAGRSQTAASLQRRAFRSLKWLSGSLAAGLLVAIAPASHQAATAANLKSFDLRWDIYPPGTGSITGRITLDLDALVLELPYDNDSVLPTWVHELTIHVPGTGSGTGTFTKSDYTGLVWNNNDGAIHFDFDDELIGQGGWGTTCVAPYLGVCGFELKRNPAGSADVPYGPVGFDIYTLMGGGQYGGLKSFAPTASVPGPLPLAGAAAMFHWSRRLRRRCRGSLAESAPFTPPSSSSGYHSD